MESPEKFASHEAVYESPAWDQLRQLVESETGMTLTGSRITRLQEAVRKSLSAPLTEAGLTRLLSHPERLGAFMERVTSALTIGETFFFRNDHHFRSLQENVVPAILDRVGELNTARQELRVWSAGCATGEEPYSVAILLDQLLSNHPNWRFSILATDLNPEFLDRARQGRYRKWSFRQTDVHENRNYFRAEGDSYQLIERIRSSVRFAYLNLVKDIYPSPLTGTIGLDLILFRNVAIYLQPDVTRGILQRFYRALRPGGWLVLGETEVTLAPTDGFETRRFGQATFFQKPLSDRCVDSDLVPLQAPVMASIKPMANVAINKVSPLPDWVPLPNRRQRVAVGSNSPTFGSTHQLAESMWDRVERCAVQDQLQEAEQCIDRITDIKTRAATRLRLARLLVAQGNSFQAHVALDRCLLEDPFLIEGQLLKASFSEEAGDFDAAETACRRALYSDRRCVMAHFHLALILRQKDNGSESRRSLQTALKLIEHRDPHSVLDYSDGMCCGRLREMARTLMEF
jgi:chemotaxis protein methyltransferase CheR